MQKKKDFILILAGLFKSVKAIRRKICTQSILSQKSGLDDEERYQYTDADAPYAPEEIKKRFGELWIF